MNLYEIALEHRQQIEALEAMTDLDEQTLADTLESLGGDFETKVRNVAAFVRNLEAEAEAQKAAEKAMKERRERNEGKAARLRLWLLECMAVAKCDTVKSPDFDVRVKACPPSVIVTNEELLKFNPACAEAWTLVPETEKLDKNKLKELLLAGVVIDGAMVVRNNRVEIK